MVHDQRFVFGFTGGDVASVRLAAAALPETPVVAPFEQEVATVAVIDGLRAYVSVIPSAQCFVYLEGSDRWPGPSIIRPLAKKSDDPCGFEVPGAPPTILPTRG